jgi:hypothetical protein
VYKKPTFGIYTAIWVGDYDLTDKLTRVNAMKTQGIRFQSGFPTEYLDVLGGSIQRGRAAINFSVNFNSLDDQVVRLANRNSINSGVVTKNTPSQMKQYAVFLLHQDENSDNHLYIPKCETLVKEDFNADKSAATSLTVTFSFQDRNRFKLLRSFGTIAASITSMGARSPLA